MLIAILSLSACNKQKTILAPSSYLEQSKLDEAKLIDTPFPVGSTFIKKSKLSSPQSITYKVNLSLIKTKKFYLQEMERLGWDLIDLSTDEEGLFFCNKNTKCCVVSIRQTPVSRKKQSSSNVFIHVYLKSLIKTSSATSDNNCNRKAIE